MFDISYLGILNCYMFVSYRTQYQEMKLGFRHSEEMIRKLEHAGLGYHIAAEDTTDKLGGCLSKYLIGSFSLYCTYYIATCTRVFAPNAS